MPYLLQLPDGTLIPCRDAHQALLLARVFVACETGRAAVEVRAIDALRSASG